MQGPPPQAPGVKASWRLLHVVVAAEGLNGQEGAVIDGVPTRVPQVLEDAASIAMAVLTHHLCDCQFFFELS